jgi:hypothetical protein
LAILLVFNCNLFSCSVLKNADVCNQTFATNYVDYHGSFQQLTLTQKNSFTYCWHEGMASDMISGTWTLENRKIILTPNYLASTYQVIECDTCTQYVLLLTDWFSDTAGATICISDEEGNDTIYDAYDNRGVVYLSSNAECVLIDGDGNFSSTRGLTFYLPAKPCIIKIFIAGNKRWMDTFMKTKFILKSREKIKECPPKCKYCKPFILKKTNKPCPCYDFFSR